MKKNIITVWTFMLLLLCIIGCKEREANVSEASMENVDITFSWWGNDDRYEYTMKVIEKFEEKYPYINVNIDYAEWDGYREKLESKLLSNTEADIMQINYDWLDLYSKDGEGFYDLKEQSKYLHFDCYETDILKNGIVNGKLNAIPIAMNTRLIFFNKDVYNRFGLKMPNTWEELFEAGKVMGAQKYYPIEIDVDSVWTMSVAYMEQTTGHKIINEQGNLEASEKDIEIMINFYCKLIENKCCKTIDEKQTTGYDKGIYGGTMQWLNEGDKYAKRLEKSDDLEAGEIMFLDDAKRSGWYIKPACMYAVKAKTQYPKEAALFLEFILNNEEAVKIQGIDKGIPVNKTAFNILNKEGMLKGVSYNAYLKTLDSKMPLNHMSDYFERNEVKAVYKKAIDSVWYNDVSVEDAAKKVVINLNKVLKEYKKDSK